MNEARRPFRFLMAGFFLLAGIAAAVPAGAMGRLATGGLTSQPIGHYEFCRTAPAECAIRLQDNGPEIMTQALKRILVNVNLDVNLSVKPMNDIEIYGREEVWTYPQQGVGDCEDYVLEKRRKLQRHGISLSNLLITVVRKPDGEGHAVLTVRTNEGDFILDNLSDSVQIWSATGYRYLKRQASTHTGRWVNLHEDNNPVVGAVRR